MRLKIQPPRCQGRDTREWPIISKMAHERKIMVAIVMSSYKSGQDASMSNNVIIAACKPALFTHVRGHKDIHSPERQEYSRTRH